MGRREDAVRAKAYELWQARGDDRGHDQDDWYIAELLVGLAPPSPSALRPPVFRRLEPGEVLRQVHVSHAGIHEFFSDSHSWIETVADLHTIFALDRNRRLHFDEGFLTASYRVAMDARITSIEEGSHFPYRDLAGVREKVRHFASLYRNGGTALLPPPLFFYPAAYQLEILDGVHRCIAAFDVMRNREPGCFKIWLGFDHRDFTAGLVVQQLWSWALRRRHWPAAVRR